MKEGTAALEHLNFFASELFQHDHQQLLVVDVKINEEDNVLILLTLLSQSYDHIVTTILYRTETLILEEVTATLLSNKIGKRPNQEVQEGSCLVVMRRRGRENEGPGSSNACHFCHRKCH